MLSMPSRACCRWTEEQSAHVDDRQQCAECGEVQVAVVGVGQDCLAADDGCQQKEDGEERIAAEDVAKGELVVPAANGGEPGGQLGK